MMHAPVRWPRPSRLQAPLKLASPKATEGLHTLGLHTVGDLLEHLPRASREARTVAALRAGEQATVTVQVRTISTRRCATAGNARARRGNACATPPAACAQRSSTSPGCSSATRPAHSCCCTERPTAGEAFVSPTTRSPRSDAGSAALSAEEAAGGGSWRSARECCRRPLPGNRGPLLHADPDARQGREGCAGGCDGGAAGGDTGAPRGCPTGRARSRRCTSRSRGGHRGRARAAGLRGAAADTARLPASPRAAKSRMPAPMRWPMSRR